MRAAFYASFLPFRPNNSKMFRILVELRFSTYRWTNTQRLSKEPPPSVLTLINQPQPLYNFIQVQIQLHAGLYSINNQVLELEEDLSSVQSCLLYMYLLATTDQIDQQSTKPFLDTCWKRFDDHSCVPTAATYSNPGQAAAPAITAGHHNTWSLVPTAAVAPAAHGWPASGLNSGGYYDLASLYQHQVTSKRNIIFVDGWRNQIVENRGFEGGFCNLLKETMPFLTDSHFEFGSDDEGSSR